MFDFVGGYHDFRFPFSRRRFRSPERSLRGRGALSPDLGQDAQAGLQVARRNRLQQFVPQLAGGVFDPLKKPARFGLQVDGFAAAIVLRVLALDPAAAFQAGEESRQGRLFDAEPFREIALGELAAREMGDGAPFRLAQAERLKALIELVPPDARRLVQELADCLRIDLAHR